MASSSNEPILDPNFRTVPTKEQFSRMSDDEKKLEKEQIVNDSMDSIKDIKHEELVKNFSEWRKIIADHLHDTVSYIDVMCNELEKLENPTKKSQSTINYDDYKTIKLRIKTKAQIFEGLIKKSDELVKLIKNNKDPSLSSSKEYSEITIESLEEFNEYLITSLNTMCREKKDKKGKSLCENLGEDVLSNETCQSILQNLIENKKEISFMKTGKAGGKKTRKKKSKKKKQKTKRKKRKGKKRKTKRRN